jgi:hypothetical protein
MNGLGVKEKTLLVTGIVFSVFMLEALIHYSMAEAKENGKSILTNFLELPPLLELIKMGLVVMVASVVSGVAVTAVEQRLHTKSAV